MSWGVQPAEREEGPNCCVSASNTREITRQGKRFAIILFCQSTTITNTFTNHSINTSTSQLVSEEVREVKEVEEGRKLKLKHKNIEILKTPSDISNHQPEDNPKCSNRIAIKFYYSIYDIAA